MSMLTLTNKKRFGVMRGCQEQIVSLVGQNEQYLTSRVWCYMTPLTNLQS
jgi:hypothetical protein